MYEYICMYIEGDPSKPDNLNISHDFGNIKNIFYAIQMFKTDQ